jgi:hypothetical protein
MEPGGRCDAVGVVTRTAFRLFQNLVQTGAEGPNLRAERRHDQKRTNQDKMGPQRSLSVMLLSPGYGVQV